MSENKNYNTPHEFFESEKMKLVKTKLWKDKIHDQSERVPKPGSKPLLQNQVKNQESNIASLLKLLSKSQK
jgi:hypothetical protein